MVARNRFPIQRQKIERLDLLQVLSASHRFPKMYWKQRDTEEEIALIGSVLNSFDIPEALPEEGALFGGCFFSKKTQENTWKAFPPCFFFLPAIEIRQNKQTTSLIARAPLDFQSSQILKTEIPSLLSRSDLPSFTEWQDQLLTCSKSKNLKKIVLGRRSTFTFSHPLDPFLLLKKQEKGTLFALQLSKQNAFFGASPEMLYVREKDQIFSEALAGTFPRGKTAQEDEHLKKALLANEKENREFDYVSQFVFSTLSSLCGTLHKDPKRSVMQTPNLHHLHHKFQGILKHPYSDKKILQALHPTPALGGEPREVALQEILRLEPFDRGLYGAPIGYLSKERSEMAVGIRSGLIDGLLLHLFAAAGIVAGSDPKKEWEELEQKINLWTNTF